MSIAIAIIIIAIAIAIAIVSCSYGDLSTSLDALVSSSIIISIRPFGTSQILLNFGGWKWKGSISFFPQPVCPAVEGQMKEKSPQKRLGGMLLFVPPNQKLKTNSFHSFLVLPLNAETVATQQKMQGFNMHGAELIILFCSALWIYSCFLMYWSSRFLPHCQS